MLKNCYLAHADDAIADMEDNKNEDQENPEKRISSMHACTDVINVMMSFATA